MHMMIDIDGGAGGLIAVNPTTHPIPSQPGVLHSCVLGPEPDGSGLAFVPSHPFPPETTARALARTAGTRTLVICPRLTSPARSRLALAVGLLLAEQRETSATGPLPVIVSGQRPQCSWRTGEIALPHLVSVVTPGGVQLRVVWELMDTEQIPAWLANQRPVDIWPVAAAA
ncbi:hypothetical protein [Pseudofrankia sp. BMG5.36]|uniref:hypothetical protein n=1 Tax=Pseudofrankia sp. BMG5.36 TaxID=1834512 RepID=UPI0008DAFD71|nr:hypothetical protein [Pseudofrankia sp. BMG5.36]OHV61335.1 hypothetical protein BCD48_39965 [Pseudofrankia sp. BMG5.36]